MRAMSMVAVLAAIVVHATGLPNSVNSLKSAVDELQADVQDLEKEQSKHSVMLAGIAGFLAYLVLSKAKQYL